MSVFSGSVSAAPDWPIFKAVQPGLAVNEEGENVEPQIKKVLIDIIRINWKTYRFISQTRGFFSQNLIYDWDFGDSQKSNLSSPKHIYSNPGTYQVKFTITDKTTGLSFSAQPQTIYISFFNIGNLKLWGLVAFILIVLMFGLRALKIMSRRSGIRKVREKLKPELHQVIRKKKSH